MIDLPIMIGSSWINSKCGRGHDRIGSLLAQAPFSSDRKRMTTAAMLGPARTSDGTAAVRVFTKGAAEVVLPLCSDGQMGADGGTTPMAEEEVSAALEGMQEEGLRVVTLAYKDIRVPAKALALLTSALKAEGVELAGEDAFMDSMAGAPMAVTRRYFFSL
jgi:magnesium-transporting ATPase (P-type)